MNKYPLGVRLFHWIVGLLFVALICVGLWMTSLPDNYPGRSSFYALHKSFGILALVLVILRFGTRLISVIPDYKDLKIKNYEIKLARLVHLLLYTLMFIMPISGYCMTNFGGYPPAFFGMPVYSIQLSDKNLSHHIASIFYQLHVYGAYLIIALVSMHILGALKHYFIDKVNIFRRVWF